MTLPLKAVLAGLLTRPMYGAELSRVTGVTEPAVGRIVDRLVTEGWATRQEPDHGPSRPPRIYVELTDDGRQAANSLGIEPMGRPEQVTPGARMTFGLGLSL